MRASRRAAVPLLALVGVVIAASPSSADSINLLRPGTSRLSPSILFDGAPAIFGSEDDATAMVDRDCVAINDDVRRTWSRFGRIDWRVAEFAWEWAPARSPEVVYVICIERRGGAPAGGGLGSLGGGAGMQMAAALLWSGGGGVVANGPAIIDPQILDPQIAGPPISNTNTLDPQILDPQISNTNALDPQILDPRISNTNALDPRIFNPQITSPFSPLTSHFSPLTSHFSPLTPDFPSALDPATAPPVPEPGTWLLLGSGLAAAWRAKKRKL